MFEADTDGRCTAKPQNTEHYHTESERIWFEAWAKPRAFDLTRTTPITNYFGADYLDGRTESAWQAWKAAAGVTP